MLIPATWMIALNGNFPAEVSTADPKGMGPCFASSLNGPVPPRFLIAPETPWGSKQPPRNDITIPSVDDHINILVEQIAFDDTNVVGRTIWTGKHEHRFRASFWLCHWCAVKERFANRQWNDVLLSTFWAKELRHYFLG